jgi:hypothetical protein
MPSTSYLYSIKKHSCEEIYLGGSVSLRRAVGSGLCRLRRDSVAIVLAIVFCLYDDRAQVMLRMRTVWAP